MGKRERAQRKREWEAEHGRPVRSRWRPWMSWACAVAAVVVAALGVYAISEGEVPCDHRARGQFFRAEPCP